ncbi:CGNR zinc finger domain-containing protein [Symbioplanes lichenis]|uniref:CGNR zinc finger domain-containing protein n=1 Tax=Symbioplanes lichenis TaxID=1629072 RepID=UPI00273898FF|nr:CGNR zinc finger domain-containing protein [Actinoplanes lichenis]
MADLRLIEEFLNTADERTFSRHGEQHVAGDRLTSPAALADWLAAHGLATEGADLSAAVSLRTALRSAVDGQGEATPALAGHPLHLVVDPSGELRIRARSARPWVDVIVETVAQSAARGDWPRLKLCAAPDCRWAFLDTSRNGRGRWCEMAVCGNRQKTRTYRERLQHEPDRRR